MKSLINLMAYGAGFLMTVIVIMIYPLFLMGTLIYTTFSFTSSYIDNTIELITDIIDQED